MRCAFALLRSIVMRRATRDAPQAGQKASESADAAARSAQHSGAQAQQHAKGMGEVRCLFDTQARIYRAARCLRPRADT